MKHLTSAFLLASLAMTSAAWATDPPQRVGSTRPVPADEPGKTVPAEPPVADDKKEPGKQAAPKKPRRRAVYQHFDEIPMRTVAPPVYAPQLTPRIDPTPVPPPVTINCVGASCIDGNGGSYRSGVGTSLISPEGRICNNNGITVQCY
ncbi:hypothetical protein KY495_01955 [Massilia sp. PAMC28688]|uniref:hypothetical protein n=1 Tax=Massilia sp. PAMC28688 TaxID=2861283 RepID=UPI001C6381A1|nr:hypothetical protein [Massilia sp. PAMC28688]QYF94025.1 hypothetical protein KY495_01955 [Massilia sp. PAMC28688]